MAQQPLIYLNCQADDSVQGGWPWVGEKQVSNVVGQSVKNQVGEVLRRPAAASSQNEKIHHQVHDASVALRNLRSSPTAASQDEPHSKTVRSLIAKQ